MFNHEVTLIKQTFTQDKYKNDIAQTKETTVLCRKESVKRNEFYSAGQGGYKPSLILIVHPYEYDGQQEVEFEGVNYRVIRTFEDDLEEMELVCEVKSNEN